jgi:hypothetical protein
VRKAARTAEIAAATVPRAAKVAVVVTVAVAIAAPVAKAAAAVAAVVVVAVAVATAVPGATRLHLAGISRCAGSLSLHRERATEHPSNSCSYKNQRRVHLQWTRLFFCMMLPT